MESVCNLLSRRYWLVLFLFFCTVNMYTLRVNLSVAIQPMSCQYGWSTSTQGMLLSSFFFGYIFGNTPGGLLASKYGPKRIIGLGIFIPALLTFLTPFVTTSASSAMGDALNCKCDDSIAPNWCFVDNIYTRDEIQCNAMAEVCTIEESDSISIGWWLMTCRVFMGFIGSFTYPAIHAMINNWAPSKERSTIIGFSLCGVYIANAITFPISSFIIDHSDWQNIFYFFGIFAIIWCLAWYLYVFDSPIHDLYITKKELKYLKKELNIKKKQSSKAIHSGTIPWREIMTNKAVLSIFICQFGYNWSFYTLITQLPTYLNKKLNYNLSEAGLVSVAPYIGQFVVTLIGSKLCDKMIASKVYSLSSIRKVATTLSTVIPAVLLAICGHLDEAQHIVILLIVGCSLLGFTSPGLQSNYTDISNQYASIIVGVSNSFGSLAGVLSPLLTGYVLEKGYFEWRFVFYVNLMINIFGAAVYCIYGHSDLIPELSHNLKKKRR